MNPLIRFPWFSIWFLGVCIAVILSLTVAPGIQIVSKAMIMASLIGLYISQAKRQNPVFLMGLVFALLGDSFLLFPGDDFFKIGLGCFLIMQLCYAYYFFQKRRIPKNSDKLIGLALSALPLVFLAIMWSKLGVMQLPVLLYSLSITTMLIMAYFRHPMLLGYKFVLVGSILFVISDILLGLNKFVTPLNDRNLSVMITYILAQYLIVTGVLYEDIRPEPKKEITDSNFSRHRA